MNAETLIDQAKEYIRNCGIPRRRISDETGVSREWIDRFMRDDIENPGVKTLQAILDHKEKSKAAA